MSGSSSLWTVISLTFMLSARKRRLPRCGVTFSARVCSRVERCSAVIGFYRANTAGGRSLGRPILHVVPELAQFCAHDVRNPAFHTQPARQVLMGRERVGEVERSEAWRLDRFLDRHAELVHVQQNLEHALLLHVASGGAESEIELAVSESERGRWRQPRPLAGTHFGGMPGLQTRLIAPGRDGK